MSYLILRQVAKEFGSVRVLHGIDLEVRDGEFVVFVGPSGCGKSTLLRTIAGLERASSGEIRLDDRIVNNVSAADRGLAMVFQSYALYPHMSVRQNLAFGLENSRMPRDEIERRVMEAARMLLIEPLLHRKPRQLSGGQRQRVAIGRAIVRRPGIFLLDEPLSNLDAELRVVMRAELAALHKRLNATMIYVTHDQTEAMTLADRIVVLRDGRIEQVGTPLELYNNPANRFVAGFIGSPRMNFIEAEAVPLEGGTGVQVNGRPQKLPHLDVTPGSKIAIGIRPHAATVTDVDQGVIALELSLVEQLGAETILHGRTDEGEIFTVSAPGQRRYAIGERIGVALPPDALHVFDAQGNALQRG
ncbi:sn-glycerol-3-phosphate ABC transporter ATP-binding protein UgpC [Microvirga sp. HBU67558]|uniref:ABC transporter ATP-binding protein n=1 Tax=Microvirga TaxID=186650 RepID=UPI001B38FC82|nr:sn-glycerol-3-phosphate ABC transporter ATP-binding protein UgpC [Microvirga sp. HBU67655]MBQ0822704.1 sn-glycerol-3-phosphate ABC transporter ATP-binding protein UgpC [Microvirga sp. HBU67558]